MHIPAALSFVITDRVPGALEERRIAAVRGAQIRDVRLTGADMGHEPANTDVMVQVVLPGASGKGQSSVLYGIASRDKF
jgi:hypothetical protein